MISCVSKFKYHVAFDIFQMSTGGGPPPPTNGGFGGPENGFGSSTGQPAAANGMISTDSAIAALGQHDQLFHRQVLHIRQQQVGGSSSRTLG